MAGADKSEIRNTKKLVYAGIAAGLLISFLIYRFWVPCQGASFIPSDIIKLHGISFLPWVLDLFPVVFGGLVYVLVQKIVKREMELTKNREEEKKYYQTISSILQKISQGNLSEDILTLSQDDEIRKSLDELRLHLIKNREIEMLRREEDRQRNWITEGLARFAELLRKNNSDLTELSYSIIVNLVKYLNANQGGIFLTEQVDDRKYLELKGCYAWGRKKYVNKQIEWGEDLVGACALEKEIIFMTDVPDNYVRITSGLGDANPRCLVLIPLLVNSDVIGVIEIASFKVFEAYELEFIKKVSESIASTVFGVRNNIQTRKLLQQSQHQAEELAQREEELRQNLEELRATQEQIALQSRELQTFTEAVNHSMLRAEFDTDARIMYLNDKFAEKMGYVDKDEALGKHISMFINNRDQDSFFTIWGNILESDTAYEGEIKFQTKQGKDLWLMATIVVEKSEFGTSKVIFLANDITLQKEMDLDYKAQIEALNRSSLKAQFLPDGMLVDGNDIFLEMMNLPKQDMQKKSIFEMIAKEELDSFREIWDKVLHGESFKGQLKQVTFSKAEKWFQCTFTSMHNIYGEVIKVIYIANDITEQKLMELDAKKQAELLQRQEEQLRLSQQELSIKLEEARREMAEQYKEIEKIKIRNEKTLEGAHDAIITFDKQGTIEFFNKSAEVLWGYSKAEIIGKNIRQLFPEDALKNDPFVATLVNGENKQVGIRKEVNIQKKTKEEVPVLLLLSEAFINHEEHTFTAFIQNIEVELF